MLFSSNSKDGGDIPAEQDKREPGGAKVIVMVRINMMPAIYGA